MSKKIFANNDQTKYALVDDDIAETIQQMKLKFRIQPNGYFRSTTKIELPEMKKRKQLLLHRLVWILKTGEEPMSSLDHIDRNKSNNMFENLRLASRREQQHNQAKRKDNTSGFIGVCHKHNVGKSYKNGYRDYWYTRIQRPDGHREQKYFQYNDEGLITAAKYYDSKAIEYFGDFCGELNFPDDN